MAPVKMRLGPYLMPAHTRYWVGSSSTIISSTIEQNGKKPDSSTAHRNRTKWSNNFLL